MVSKDLKQVEVWNSSEFHALFRIYEILTYEKVQEESLLIFLFCHSTSCIFQKLVVSTLRFQKPKMRSSTAIIQLKLFSSSLLAQNPPKISLSEKHKRARPTCYPKPSNSIKTKNTLLRGRLANNFQPGRNTQNSGDIKSSP